MARPQILCLDRPPGESDAQRTGSGRRVVWIGDRVDGRPGVLVGVVTSSETSLVVEAVLRGWDLVVHIDLQGERRRLLLEDLRRIGDMVAVSGGTGPPLDAVDEALLDHLASGATVGQAAERCSLSGRTAARRLAALRQAYGVETTAAMVGRWQAEVATRA